MNNVSQIRTCLSVRHALRKTMMTRQILIPVRIFFILGRQIMPGRESRTHVLKFLARTLDKGMQSFKKIYAKVMKLIRIFALHFFTNDLY